MVNDELKISERDRFIYEVVTDRYKFEWQRFSQIESKATTMLGFLGIIFTLESAAGLFILNEYNDGYKINFIVTIILLFSFAFLLMSMLYVLSSIKMKQWYTLPNIEHFMSEYVNADKNSVEIIQSLYSSYDNSIYTNHKNNEEKAMKLTYSFESFKASILLLSLLIIILSITSLLKILESKL